MEVVKETHIDVELQEIAEYMARQQPKKELDVGQHCERILFPEIQRLQHVEPEAVVGTNAGPEELFCAVVERDMICMARNSVAIKCNHRHVVLRCCVDDIGQTGCHIVGIPVDIHAVAIIVENNDIFIGHADDSGGIAELLRPHTAEGLVDGVSTRETYQSDVVAVFRLRKFHQRRRKEHHLVIGVSDDEVDRRVADGQRRGRGE